MVENPVKDTLQNDPSLHKTLQTSIWTVWIFIGVQLSLSAMLAFLSQFMIEMTGSYWLEDFSFALLFLLTTLFSGWIAGLYGSSTLHLHPFHDLKNMKFSKVWLLKGVTMSYGVSLLLSLVLTVINAVLEIFGLYARAPELEDYSSLPATILSFLSVVVLAPILEEIVFRGVICRGLSRCSKGFAVIFSALLFAMAHLNLGQGLPVFGMGIVFGFVYLRSGSLAVPVFVHIVNNLIAFLTGMIPEAGTVMLGFLILILAVFGWIWIAKERSEISGMFAECSSAKECWRMAAHSAGFWILVGAFVIMSIVSLVSV